MYPNKNYPSRIIANFLSLLITTLVLWSFSFQTVAEPGVSYPPQEKSSSSQNINSEPIVDQTLKLTEEEIEWLNENTVRVGIEEWPPIVSMHPNGRVVGVAGSYLELISKKTGLKFEYVGGLWENLLNGLKNQDIDLLPATYFTEERTTFGLYSTPYFHMREFIYVKQQNQEIKRIEDLADKKIAVVKDYGTIPKLKKQFPKATIVETVDLMHSINAVLNGEADALMEAQIAVELTIENNAIVGLRGINQNVFPASPIHFFSRKDQPILHSIIQKGLNTVSKQEHQREMRKWLGGARLDKSIFDKSIVDKSLLLVDSEEHLKLFISAAVFLFLAMLLMAFALPRYLSDETIAKHVGSKSFRIVVLGVTCVIFFIVMILVWFTIEQNKRSAIKQVQDDLDFVHANTSERLLDWVEDRKTYLRELGQDPILIDLTKRLLDLPVDAQQLKQSQVQAEIREYFNLHQGQFGRVGFFIINPDRISIASRRDNNIGTRNLIAIRDPKRLNMAFEGGSVFIPPILSDVEIKSELTQSGRLNDFSMFFAVPIKDRDGKILAVLTQRLLPAGRLSKIMQYGSLGLSGESYLVNDQGGMISRSRFVHQLESIGIAADDDSLLELRDPGGNMIDGYIPSQVLSSLPLTLSARSLKEQADYADMLNTPAHLVSANLEGYRDYRGVTVFGVWHWEAELGIGMITEIDREEVMANFNSMRKNLLTIAIVTLLLAIASSVLTVTIGQRSTRFVLKARDQLEEKVQERTAELKQREELMWDLYENAPVAYASLAPNGQFLKYNRAFAELIAISRDELDDLNWHTIAPEDSEALEQASQAKSLLDHEIKVKRGDGKTLYTSLSTVPVFDSVNKLSEIRFTLLDITERKSSQKRFTALMESAPDAMLVVDVSGTLVLVNSQVEEVFGYQREQLLGQPIEILVPEPLRAKHRTHRSLFLNDPTARSMGKNLQLMGRRANAETFPVEVSLSPIQTDEGKLVVASVRDITQRRKDERRMERTNQGLNTLTLINEEVMNSQTEQQLLHGVCRILVEVSQQKMVWVGFECRDGQKNIQVQAHYGYEKGFLDDIHLTWAKANWQECPEGEVLRSAQRLIIKEIQQEPYAEHWKNAAIDRGYTSLVAVPLRHHGDAFGVIAAYSDGMAEVDEEGLRILERFADNVANGIMAIRSEVARKEAEEELSVAEERSRLLLHSVDEGIFGIDQQGRLTFVNPSVESLLGYTQAELIGNKAHPLIYHRYQDGRDYPEQESPMYAAYTYGESNHIDDEVLWRKDGSYFKAEYSCVPLKKEERIVGAVITFRDISERREAESKMKAVWDNSGDGYVWLDEQFRFVGCNQPALQQLGYQTNEEILGKTPLDFSPQYQPDGKPSKDKAQMYAQRAIEGNSQRFEWYYHKSDGTAFWSEITLVHLVVQDKPLFLEVWHDVTLEIEARQALEKAKLAAEDATKAKSDFLANMSHEIRTPMNAIIGMSSLALKTDLNRKQRNYVEKVNRSAESLLGIINDILDFSKIEAGKMDMENINFRLESVLDNLANLVGLKAEEKGVELLFDIAADVPMALVGDPLRLGQILVNLGNNAVKFTEEGEIVVSIRVQEIAENTTTLLFSVRDSGIGMSAEQQSKLFKSFSQADSSTTRKYGGTGLGLTISKCLTQMMNGKIWVESQQGQGSTFLFTAVLKRQQGVPIGRVVPQLPELQGLKVLAVDDNATAREILTEILLSFGFNVEQVSSGQAALDTLKSSQEPFDLVLMDWMMPVMDGIETTQKIVQTCDPSPKVIMITAYGREEAMDAAGDLAFSAILAKPVSPSSLLDSIMIAFGHEVESGSRATKNSDQESDAKSKLAGAKILLVEDNEINQELALELLSNAGIQAELAENGQEALEKLQKHFYDGVLMDCQMPVMDGFEATKRLREQACFKDLPIIAMTANVMAGDREKVLASGMNDHIGKPINVHEMYATLAQWITPSQPHRIPSSLAIPTDDVSQPVIIPELPGIDTESGLATTQNNPKLYRKLLIKFYQSQQDFEVRYREAQNSEKKTSEDPQAATRCAHTLKGVAGNIGATQVYDAAKNLETASKENADKEQITQLLLQVSKQLKPVLAGLQTLVMEEPGIKNQNIEIEQKQTDNTEDTHPITGGDSEKIHPLLKQLRSLLEDDDTDATDIVEELDGLANIGSYKIKLKRLSKAIDGYEFDQALEELDRFEAELEA